MAYSQDDINRLNKYIELQQKASNNLTEFSKIYETISELGRSSRHLDKEILKLEDKRVKINEKIEKLYENQSKYKKDEFESQLKTLKKEKTSLTNNIKLAKKSSEEAKVLGAHLSEQLNTRTLINATIGTTIDLGKKVLKTIYNQNQYLFEQQKAVKMTQLQMSILSKESEGFRDNLYKSSLHTNQLGIDSKALAQIQATYSNEIGRGVSLTEEGLIAMSELAEGTILGQENAAIFAANMENFGYSAEAARDYMEETLNMGHELGVNGAKLTDEINKNLKLANRYNFRGGIRGLREMTAQSIKFKINMDSVASIADDVFNPEGAITMASNLSVLGGQWAQIADPFSLMFKARTDLDGLTNDIIKASHGIAQFNEETGEFNIASMEMHRLKEVAKATGLNYDDLTKSAREAAKFAEIKTNINGDFDESIQDFISSRGKWNNNRKKWEITINGDNYLIDELNSMNQSYLKNIVRQEESLEDIAKNSKNFNEQWENLMNQFRGAILPGFEAFTNSLTKGLFTFQDFMSDNDVLDRLSMFGEKVGEFGAIVTELIIKNPIATGVMALLAKPAMWVARGRLLGLGFNQTASAGNGIAGNSKSPFSFGGKIGKRLMGSGGGKIMKGVRGVGKFGAIGSLAGLGFDAFSNFSNDDLSGGDAMLKTLDQNKYAMLGAAIGSVIPGLGTIAGLGIGGLADMLVPMLSEGDGLIGDYGKKHNDFVSRPGEKPISFSSSDTLIGLKKGGAIDNFLLNQGENNNNAPKNITIDFNKPLKINGSITIDSKNGKLGEIDLNNPIIIRELTNKIQQELSASLNGKISPNQTI